MRASGRGATGVAGGRVHPLEPLAELPGGRLQLHLAGFMGSGKTTVGRLLARRLLWNFLDLDGLVARHAGRSIPEIFAADGQAAFRRIEAHVLSQAVQKPRTVVALGGGTLLDPGNRRLCAEVAVVVWLRCPLGVCIDRCRGTGPGRPLWGPPEELRRLLRARLPGYRSARVVVDADRPATEVADAVLRSLGIGR